MSTPLSPADRAREIADRIVAETTQELRGETDKGPYHLAHAIPSVSKFRSAIERAIAEAVDGERARCVKFIKEVADDQAKLAKGNYSHEQHAAYMLRDTAEYIRSQS